jgi:sugar/nucleoside kinase (ribokinase family)
MDEGAGGRVLGIGELLWDLFPDGPRLGGAPFNVVANLRRFGDRAAFVTAVGDDALVASRPGALPPWSPDELR